ncbi:MAG: glycoside hydrolase N-terminal domain-containing protein, partial [Bacteroidetes bacterium]|nr:glycoside hydrolase N-terminal domain-containing protein [Bacteroidota bacterium]
MRYILPLFALILAPGFSRSQVSDKSIDPGTFLWYSGPASKWEEALPVGNGRLGAMIYGGVNEAIIQFNEETY